MSGIDLDLYELSQNMLDFCRVDCCLEEMKNLKDREHIISIPNGTFNILFTIFLLDFVYIEEMDFSRCFVRTDNIWCCIYSTIQNASLVYLYNKDFISVLYFKEDIEPLKDLIETAIEKIYTRLQEYVGQENLIEKEKCINGVNESRKITVNDLKPYFMVSTEII